MSEDYINLDRTIEEYEKRVKLKEEILADIIKSTSIPACGIFSREYEIKMLKITVIAMKEKQIRERKIFSFGIIMKDLNNIGSYIAAKEYKDKIELLKSCEVE